MAETMQPRQYQGRKCVKRKGRELRADAWGQPHVGAGEKGAAREGYINNESENLKGGISEGKGEKRSEEGMAHGAECHSS